MSSSSEAPGRCGAIEAARAVAALSVVLMHTTHLMRVPQFSGHVALGGAFEFGYTGVDFFFVLSGFIITWVHHAELGAGASRWPSYLWKRFVRIFPIYWAVLALSVAPSVLARLASGRTPLFDADLGDMPGTLLLWIGGEQPVYVGVAWSLQFEVLFYLSFCVLLLHRALGLALYALWAGAVTAAAAGLLPGPLPLSLGDPHCLQFLLGVLAGLTARGRWLSVFEGRGRVALALLVWVGAVVFERLGAQGPHAFEGRVALGVAAAAVLLTLTATERAGRLSAPRWLVSLGAVSYSLYLAHVLLINMTLALLAKLGVYHALPEFVVFLIALTVGIAGSWLIGRHIELPMVARLRRWRLPRAEAVRADPRPAA